jgi:type IV pilus assembly protein PilN
MIHINLLPVREIKRRNKAIREIALSSAAFLCFLVLLASISLYQINYAGNLQQEHNRIQSEKQQYAKVLEEIKKLEAEKKTLLTRIEVIKQLKESSSLTVHVLDEIATLTPTHRMWLKKLQQTGNGLTLSGMALDNQTVAKYMDDLGTSAYIQNVILASASMEKYADRNLKSFSISCAVGMPSKKNSNKNLN